VGDFPALEAIAVKLTWVPVQIFVAEAVIVTIGEIMGLITTVVRAVSEEQPFESMATAIQVPAYAAVTLLKTAVLVYWPPPKPASGFSIKYVVPGLGGADKMSWPPAHTGLFDLNAGAGCLGNTFTLIDFVTVALPGPRQAPLT
jgi:hypothetical protein